MQAGENEVKSNCINATLDFPAMLAPNLALTL